jgi:hypothetical protein
MRGKSLGSESGTLIGETENGEEILAECTTNAGSAQEAESQAATRFCEERDIGAVRGERIPKIADPTGLHRLHR